MTRKSKKDLTPASPRSRVCGVRLPRRAAVAAVAGGALALVAAPGGGGEGGLGSLRVPDPTAAGSGSQSLATTAPLPSSASTPPTPSYTDGELIVRFRHWAG